MLHVITRFASPPTNLNDGRFLTEIGLYVSILSLVNITTGWWPCPYFTSDMCAARDPSVN